MLASSNPAGMIMIAASFHLPQDGTLELLLLDYSDMVSGKSILGQQLLRENASISTTT